MCESRMTCAVSLLCQMESKRRQIKNPNKPIDIIKCSGTVLRVDKPSNRKKLIVFGLILKLFKESVSWSAHTLFSDLSVISCCSQMAFQSSITRNWLPFTVYVFLVLWIDLKPLFYGFLLRVMKTSYRIQLQSTASPNELSKVFTSSVLRKRHPVIRFRWGWAPNLANCSWVISNWHDLV